MKIAVLGWGSLIWCPRNLRVSGEWNKDGPQLPIEFARVSRDGRLTLVILSSANPVPVLWARMDARNLDEAIKNLKEREETTTDKIGFIDLISDRYHSGIIEILEIKTWAQGIDIDAVIWTDLPSNFETKMRKSINKGNIVSYLNSLQGKEKQLAEKYIRNAPVQIRTEFRTHIKKQLGWA